VARKGPVETVEVNPAGQKILELTLTVTITPSTADDVCNFLGRRGLWGSQHSRSIFFKAMNAFFLYDKVF
jgi:hypothetical protein